jgi:hypothetical protein
MRWATTGDKGAAWSGVALAAVAGIRAGMYLAKQQAEE